MKQRLLGTPAGRLALRLRNRYELIRTAVFQSENVGGISNDQLAEHLLTRICLPGRTMLDVGSHIGSIIAEVRGNDPAVNVIAFEAIPEKVAALRRKFPGVEIHGCAVGEQDGEISFFVDTLKSGYSSLARPNNTGQSNAHKREIRVPLHRVDSLITSNTVDLMKIDVEGAELGVLRGAVALIDSNRPAILFESGPPEENQLGYTKESLWEWLDSHRYCVLVPNRLAHNDDGLGREGFVESHLYPRRTTNYFGIPRERREEYRDRARRILGIRIAS